MANIGQSIYMSTLQPCADIYDRHYNDISNWKWTSLLNVLGDATGKVTRSYTVHSQDELSKLLDDPKFARADKMQLVEVMMDKLDAPRALQVQAELSGKTNAYDAKIIRGGEEVKNAVDA